MIGRHFRADVRLTLPSAIYATPGLECNVYFDNVVLVLNRRNFAFDVTCDKGLQLAERWAFTPTVEECGDYPIAIEVRDETNVVSRSRRVDRSRRVARPPDDYRTCDPV